MLDSLSGESIIAGEEFEATQAVDASAGSPGKPQVVGLKFFPGFFDAGQTSPTRTLISSLYIYTYIYINMYKK